MTHGRAAGQVTRTAVRVDVPCSGCTVGFPAGCASALRAASTAIFRAADSAACGVAWAICLVLCDERRWYRLDVTLAAVVAVALAGTYALRAKYGSRCSQCRRGFAAGTPLRWCAIGHTLHLTCVKHVMNREVCPICGIYVSKVPVGDNTV